jgi:hypothetical protein
VKEGVAAAAPSLSVLDGKLVPLGNRHRSGRNKAPPRGLVVAQYASRGFQMELILIIVVVVLLFGGGGYYGRRRGHW